MLSYKSTTWGTTATLTESGQRLQWRLAKLGAAVLGAAFLAQVYGAALPGEAYLAILGLFGSTALGAGWLTGQGAAAHASQYQGGSPTAAHNSRAATPAAPAAPVMAPEGD